MSYIVHTGEVEETLLSLEPHSLSACLTDPPYALGFMDRPWDYELPSVHTWRALWRAMKPGAMLLAFGHPRTAHRLACGIEDAGFALRDTIMWVYGSGFPKSQDAAKATKNKAYEGYGTALKPAYEPIIVARKPMLGTLATNLAEYGVGTLAIDACRIEASGRPLRESRNEPSLNAFGDGLNGSRAVGTTDVGRWPANVILDEAAGAVLDAQSGTLRSGVMHAGQPRAGREGVALGAMGGDVTTTTTTTIGDSGGASRFFYCAKASRSEREAGLDDLALFDAHELVGRKEDSAGMQSPRAGAGRSSARRNNHPTVKPIALAEYLAKLVLPPGGQGRILVPYSGSGSEMIGALRAGWTDVCGIERDPAYVKIAEARLAHWAGKVAA